MLKLAFGTFVICPGILQRFNTSDRTYIGDPNPDFIYGLTNTFTWKDLSLSIFIQGSYGNDIFNVSRMETEGMYDGKNQSTEVEILPSSLRSR